MTEHELAAIEARAAKLPPGDWAYIEQVDAHFPIISVWHAIDNTCVAYQCVEPKNIEEVRDNIRFIAHARTDIPALIAEVRHLRAALEEAEARADATWHTLIGTEMCLSRMRERREESGAAEEARPCL